MTRIVLAAGLAACLAAIVPAQSQTMAPDVIDAALILPPPPAAGSPAAKADLAELDRIVAARTQAEEAAAARDDGMENPSAFQGVLGPSRDLARLPATAKLLDDVMAAQKAAARSAKMEFHRDRPWVAEPGLATCAMRGGEHSSYPSGHATMGFAVGVVLADVVPDKAQPILARAAEFAHNRLVCGMHYPSDVVAGQALGTAVAELFLHDPAHRSEIAAAAAELKAAQPAP